MPNLRQLVFCRLLKTSTPFIRGRLILSRPLFWFVQTSPRAAPAYAPLVCRPMVTSLPLPAPVSPAPLLLAPVPFCLLALSFLPVPACSGTCRLCLLPLVPAAAPAPVPACLPSDGHQFALSCARRSLSVPLCDGSLPLPTSSRQAHRPKPPGPPSVSVRLAPPSSVLSGFRRLVSPRSRTCPSLHFPACPCSRSRTCAFLRQSALSAPSRPGPCAPGPFLRTRASENHRGE